MRKIFYPVFLALAVLVSICNFGCTTYIERGPASIASSYNDYRRGRQHMDHDTVVAMLAYTASKASRTSYRNVKSLDVDLVSMLNDMRSNTAVSINYPVAPNEAEIKYVRDFITRFCRYATKQRLSGKRLSEEYSMYAGSLISRIQDLEYTGPR